MVEVDDLTFKVTLPVRFRDLDVLGHVNSTTYIQYMETARVRLLDHLLPRVDWYRVPIILVSTRCEYKQAITTAHRVDVAVWTSRVGTSAWDLDYEVASEEGVAAIGRTTQVAYDHGRQQVTPIPDGLNRGLKAFMGAPLTFRG